MEEKALIVRQPTINHYVTKYNTQDSNLTTNERVDIIKTLSYNFFDNHTMGLSYYLMNNTIPKCEYVLAQYGFNNCKNDEEKYHLMMVYKVCLEQCYKDYFSFAPLGFIYEYFKNDMLDEFIIGSYNRIGYNDVHIKWFMENKDKVKHYYNYDYFMEKRKILYSKK